MEANPYTILKRVLCMQIIQNKRDFSWNTANRAKQNGCTTAVDKYCNSSIVELQERENVGIGKRWYHSPGPKSTPKQ
eukprot:1462937-Amphidinium_carterae.1